MSWAVNRVRPDLDQGSGLEIYWGFCPDYYTQYREAKDIEDSSKKRAFKLLKKLEERLLAKDCKTNLIPFQPPNFTVDASKAQWQIPVELTRPNLP